MWFNFHFYGGMNKKMGVVSVLRDLKLLWACYHVNETVERYQGFYVLILAGICTPEVLI